MIKNFENREKTNQNLEKRQKCQKTLTNPSKISKNSQKF